MAERPAVLRTEPVPGSRHGELRLHCADGQAIAFGDGYGIHALHGTPVPEWVLTAPTAGRIKAEKNIEVRRSAIERIGWETYIREARLSRVAVCPDPANPGAELTLYGDLAGSASPPSSMTRSRPRAGPTACPEPSTARWSVRTGLDVLAHLEREVTVPVIDGLQAQGDLLVIPLDTLTAASILPDAYWRDVPAAGIDVIRAAAGGNPEHGGSGIAPGTYVIRRQREKTGGPVSRPVFIAD